jgi:histidinol phosphatase-like PHP family hydrolase
MADISSYASKFDLHIHTTFSDGECTIDKIPHIAKLKRLNFVAVTDHYSEYKKIPNRMTGKTLQKYLDKLEEVGVYKGVEVDILEDGSVSISKKNANRFDFIIGGVHSLKNRKFWMDPRPIWNPKGFVDDLRRVFIKSMETGLVDVLAHPTWLPWSIRYKANRLIDKHWIKRVLIVAKKYEVAMEVNGTWKVPKEFFVDECLKQRVSLAVGSDAHKCSSIGDTSYPVMIFKSLNIPIDSMFIPTKKK